MKGKFVSALLIVAILLPIYSIGGRISGTALAANDESYTSSKQFLSHSSGSNAPLSVGGPIGQNSGSWSLTFNDEFSGTSLDRTKWRSDYVDGVNGELQEYVDDDSHNNYPESNGILSLVARKENYQGKNYTSGIITTQDRFYQKYGYLEIRAKMPSNAMGLWPGFWTLPNPSGWPPEIDTIEWLGRQPTVAYMNIHYPNPIGESLGWYNTTDWSTGYHTYGTEWRSDAIIWYIDGVERKRFTDTTKIPSVAMFLVANLAVGGTWPHSPDSTTVFPAYFNIDYIRVWKHVDTQPGVTINVR
jgi:beta-glucanase (GH16 family)